EAADGRDAEFSTSGRVISFPGFLRAYVEGSDDPDAELGDREVRLPSMAAGDGLDAAAMEAESHTTSPPARYPEASLVKALEELGVGRPSTYASIMETIQSRGYAWKKGTALVPSWTSFAVITLLEQHFGRLVDYGFTAAMEEDLDEIARGGEESVPWLTRFYFGTVAPGIAAGGDGASLGDGAVRGNAPLGGVHVDGIGLKRLVSDQLGAIDAREVNSIPIGEDAEGRAIVVRVGRYGPYVERGGERASVPEELAPDELTVERAEQLLSVGSSDRVVGEDPESGLPVIVRAGRYGPYVQVGEADEVEGKPRTASLLSTMDPSTVTLEDALKVLQLPRVVGADPGSGEEIVATNGRYGPYLKKGADSRSLESEQQLFDVTLDQALALFAQPRQRRGQRSTAPLRELGPDPVTGTVIQLKDGRFGPYVTDGTTNASLRKGDTVDGLTPERAHELLADRRAAGPAKKTARKAPAKKAASTTRKAAGTTKKAATKKAAGAPAKAAAKGGSTSSATGKAAGPRAGGPPPEG
ncbi:MAG TPA: topoisomerase C-terminal repeat-containing protein, partial [Acidimicrobiales bacterium]|nr:topoisomerase C-terminal repeat-containing protein [Acidimicrobiales bacterium]